MEGKIQTRMELPLTLLFSYTKMAWNGKRQLQSASESLLNNFEFVESALVCVQYPVENAASSCLTHCHRFSDYRASLAERRRRKKEDRRFGPFSDLPMWHSAMVSSNANSLFADENTRESLVGFIKACDYI